MPGFGVLVLVFLFGAGLFGFALRPEVQDTARLDAVTTRLAVGPITEADTGTTITLPLGLDTDLRLSHRSRWSEPRATGAVKLQPVASLVDAGYDAWHIVPTRKGRATITSNGSPGAKRFRVTIRVG
jgi:hypothetical protein